ncbi:MAG TPA: DUF3662 and FHA domain-containing protein [Coriobacteriia bacterium]|nr:DUF3662 and FHA domain-containing protein [Coriobacteriia bacterium]
MSVLSDFEDRLAGAVEGLFAGAFRSPVQPAEIAKALGKAMDDRKAVGVGKVYVPHVYTVALSRDDAKVLGGFGETLAGELATYLVGHAAERGYALAGRPVITFVAAADLRLGRFRVAASSASAPHDGGIATVTVSGAGHDVALAAERVSVGRLASCDIRLSDANVSREHAVFVREGAGWAIEDLGSTNGTYLNGERVTAARLRDGDVISIGASELVFHGPGG